MAGEQAVMGTTHTGRVMPDGSMELVIVVSPGAVNRSSVVLMEPGCNIGMVALDYKPAKWGAHARALRLSSFFRRPEVWSAVASDQHYQRWVRAQPCARTRRPGSESDPIVYAHVRRVADGSGSSIKPLYSGIPLLNSVHQLQHQKGESAVHPDGKEWFDQARIRYVQKWAWETLKRQLGYGHWSQVPPEKLRDWAHRHDVAKHLPAAYRG